MPQLFTYGNYYSKQNSDTLEYIITERGKDLTIIGESYKLKAAASVLKLCASTRVVVAWVDAHAYIGVP